MHRQIVNIFNRGGIIIFPTDTAYGIGCRIDMKDSVDRLFRIRKRPVKKAVPVLVSSINMAEKYWQKPIDKKTKGLITKYWPGALTAVYSADLKKVYSRIRGGQDTLGLRMPDHDELLDIIDSVGAPIIGTSANFHKGKTPFAANDIDVRLLSLVDFFFKGRIGADGVSTVVDCTKNPFSIIRQGVIKVDDKDL